MGSIFAETTRIDRFLGLLVEKRVKKAFETLVVNSTFGDTELGAKEIEKVKETFLNVVKVFGNAKSYEAYQERKVSKNIMVYSYFSYHQYSPMLWKFLMYKNPDNEWVLINIQLKFDLKEPLMEKND